MKLNVENLQFVSSLFVKWLGLGPGTPPGRATQVAGATQVARSTSIFFTKLWTYENI